jgi:hypothetical protein
MDPESNLSSGDDDALDERVQRGVGRLEDSHAEEEDGVDAGKLLPEHEQQADQKRPQVLAGYEISGVRIFTTLYSVCNYFNGPISWSVTLHLARKVCQ